MGMARGEGDVYFGTDVGKWGAEGAGFRLSQSSRSRRVRSATTVIFGIIVARDRSEP